MIKLIIAIILIIVIGVLFSKYSENCHSCENFASYSNTNCKQYLEYLAKQEPLEDVLIPRISAWCTSFLERTGVPPTYTEFHDTYKKMQHTV